jgi:hypothetical protein
MRKFFVIVLVFIIAALAYLSYAHLSGGTVPTFGLPLGGERAKIREKISHFFEDLKFKNESGLKDFIAKDKSAKDIDGFVAKVFEMKLSDMDINTVKIVSIELDSQNKRARARIHLYGQDMRLQKAFDINKIIYLYLDSEATWLIDIEHIS